MSMVGRFASALKDLFVIVERVVDPKPRSLLTTASVMHQALVPWERVLRDSDSKRWSRVSAVTDRFLNVR
jgi:hypothetical protein